MGMVESSMTELQEAGLSLLQNFEGVSINLNCERLTEKDMWNRLEQAMATDRRSTDKSTKPTPSRVETKPPEGSVNAPRPAVQQRKLLPDTDVMSATAFTAIGTACVLFLWQFLADGTDLSTYSISSIMLLLIGNLMSQRYWARSIEGYSLDPLATSIPHLSASIILSAGTTLVALALLTAFAIPFAMPLILFFDQTASTAIMSCMSNIVTPQNIIKTLAADAILSEIYSIHTPLRMGLGYLISITTTLSLILLTVLGWITEDSKHHVDKFMRIAPTELQCAWLATLQPYILLQWLRYCWWPSTRQARLQTVFMTASAAAFIASIVMPSGPAISFSSDHMLVHTIMHDQ
jgi:hypothetical protein